MNDETETQEWTFCKGCSGPCEQGHDYCLSCDVVYKRGVCDGMDRILHIIRADYEQLR